MNIRALLFLFSALATLAQGAEPTSSSSVPLGVRSPITFQESIPLGSAEQLKIRLHAREEPAPYDIRREQFEIRVPKCYKESEAFGLLVWISPNPKPSLPAGWDEVLEKQKLVFIGAFNSGNQREVFDRMRLAVDANFNVRQLYNIDSNRVYVSGHSGGARVASMLGVAYADMFTGAACFMGVNFFRDLTAPDGTFYEMRYFPHPEIAAQAITEGRFALITGEKDFNLANTETIYKQGFLKEEFRKVKLFNIPGQGHSLPTAEWFEKAIRFLDQPN